MFAQFAGGGDVSDEAPNYMSGTTGKLGRKTCAGQRVESPESNWQAKDMTGMEEQELAELRQLFDRTTMGNAVGTGSYSKYLVAEDNKKIAEAARLEKEKRKQALEEAQEARRAKTQALRAKRGDRDTEAMQRVHQHNAQEAAQARDATSSTASRRPRSVPALPRPIRLDAQLAPSLARRSSVRRTTGGSSATRRTGCTTKRRDVTSSRHADAHHSTHPAHTRCPRAEDTVPLRAHPSPRRAGLAAGRKARQSRGGAGRGGEEGGGGGNRPESRARTRTAQQHAPQLVVLWQR